MLKRNHSSRWMMVVLTALLGLGGVGGCAWLMSHHGEPQATRTSSPARDALPEAATPAALATANGYEQRDPFSRRMAQRYHSAAAAGVGEAGALAAREPGVAGEVGGAAAVAGALPSVGAGPVDGEYRSRRALWLAMGLVVAIGLSAMWLARRQSRA